MGQGLRLELLIKATEASAGRDETTNDHVLLETAQPIALALNRGFRQHTGGLLEGGRRDEAVGVQRGLGDTQQNRCEFSRSPTGDRHGLVHLIHLAQLNQLTGEKGGVAGIFNPHFAGHLPHDHFDVLVINGHALGLVDVLHLLDQSGLQASDRLVGRIHRWQGTAQVFEDHLQQFVGVDRTIGEQVARFDLLAIADHHGAAQQDRVLGVQLFAFVHRHGGVVLAFGLLNLDGAGLTAEHSGLTGTTGLEQFLNTGQTLNDVTGLGPLKHQLGQGVSAEHQIAIADVQDRVGGDHVRTSNPQGEAAAFDLFHLTAMGAGETATKVIAFHNTLASLEAELAATEVNGDGVAGALNDQTANRFVVLAIWQLSHTVVLAEDLNGGDHIAALDVVSIGHLHLGVGGAMAGIGEGVAPHQMGFQDGELQTLDGLGALVLR